MSWMFNKEVRDPEKEKPLNTMDQKRLPARIKASKVINKKVRS